MIYIADLTKEQGIEIIKNTDKKIVLNLQEAKQLTKEEAIKLVNGEDDYTITESDSLIEIDIVETYTNDCYIGFYEEDEEGE
jgi:hypothetical protein